MHIDDICTFMYFIVFVRILISSRQEKNIIDRTTGSEYCTFCVWRQIFKELAKEMNQEA